MTNEELDDLKIIKLDIVSEAAVYIGGVTELRDITDKLKWRSEGNKGHEDYVEYLTLQEIYQQVRSDFSERLITIFQEEPLSGKIYQCGNYKDDQWVEYGITIGYA